MLPERLATAIIDEADSILIDESRNPMIISQPLHDHADLVRTVDRAAERLWRRIGREVAREQQRAAAALAFPPPPPSSSSSSSSSSRPGSPQEERARRDLAARVAEQAEQRVKERYLQLDRKARGLSLTEEGMARVFAALAADPAVSFAAASRERRAPHLMDLWEDDVPWGQMAVTALKAREYYSRGAQYIVQEEQQQEDGEEGEGWEGGERNGGGALSWSSDDDGGGEPNDPHHHRSNTNSNASIAIIDESTGRVRTLSRYTQGLHQAIEAKEGVKVRAEASPTASVTFQVFFRFYRTLCGMTGTARAAAAEFYETYGLRVVAVPTHKPPKRVDHAPRLYFAERDKLAAVVGAVERSWALGRPVLIGTTSVNESEAVLEVLTAWAEAPEAWRRRRREGGGGSDSSDDDEQRAPRRPRRGGPLDARQRRALLSRVRLLNARPENVRTEAQIVAAAGLPGSVTIATNMAGRGTDIILGGSAEGLAQSALMRLLYRRLLMAAAGVPCGGPGEGGEGGAGAAAAAGAFLPDALLDALEPSTAVEASAAADARAIPPLPLPELGAYDGAWGMAGVLAALNAQEGGGGGGGGGGGNGNGSGNGAGERRRQQQQQADEQEEDGCEPVPRGLHLALVAAMAVAQAQAQQQQQQLGLPLAGASSSSPPSAADGPPAVETWDQAAALANEAMASAQAAVRETTRRLRAAHPQLAQPLEELDFEGLVAPKAEEVMAELERGGGGGGAGAGAAAAPSSSPPSSSSSALRRCPVLSGERGPLQRFAARAAALLWLWLARRCERMARGVRRSGGLLVLGVSLQETGRVERQLRGRAGRQGDPGETRLLFDLSDRLIQTYGLGCEFFLGGRVVCFEAPPPRVLSRSHTPPPAATRNQKNQPLLLPPPPPPPAPPPPTTKQTSSASSSRPSSLPSPTSTALSSPSYTATSSAR
jgi:preprotein translocase subunit SecA